jgi:hypothetical protein
LTSCSAFSGSVTRVERAWGSLYARYRLASGRVGQKGQLTTPKSGKVRAVPMARDVAAALAGSDSAIDLLGRTTLSSNPTPSCPCMSPITSPEQSSNTRATREGLVVGGSGGEAQGDTLAGEARVRERGRGGAPTRASADRTHARRPTAADTAPPTTRSHAGRRIPPVSLAPHEPGSYSPVGQRHWPRACSSARTANQSAPAADEPGRDRSDEGRDNYAAGVLPPDRPRKRSFGLCVGWSPGGAAAPSASCSPRKRRR